MAIRNDLFWTYSLIMVNWVVLRRHLWIQFLSESTSNDFYFRNKKFLFCFLQNRLEHWESFFIKTCFSFGKYLSQTFLLGKNRQISLFSAIEIFFLNSKMYYRNARKNSRSWKHLWSFYYFIRRFSSVAFLLQTTTGNQQFVILQCFFFQKGFKKKKIRSKEFKFTWKMRNRLNQKKNQISDFYFSSYGHFFYVITPSFDEFFMITRKIKIGEFFCYFFHSIQHTPHHP